MNYKNQQGFLMIVAVLLIMVIGCLGVTVAYMIASGALQNSNFTQSEKAFDIATSGLEKATRFLATPFLTGTNPRIACGSLTGNSYLTNSSFGSGTFTATTIAGSPSYASSALNGALTYNATSVTLTSTTGFAATGRVIIDGERINYSAISGNNLIGLIRGADNTVAAAHANGAYAAQYQCSLDAIGYIPNSTSPLYQREQQQNVELPEGWAVGAATGTDFTLTHWNYPNALAWTDASITANNSQGWTFVDWLLWWLSGGNQNNTNNLNTITMLSNGEAWSAGDQYTYKFIFFHLLGTTWNKLAVSGACIGQNLSGISAVSADEAWAVGSRYQITNCSSGNYRYTILYWNGSSWTELSSATTPSIPNDGNSSTIETLNAIQVIATTNTGIGNIGFTVGQNGRILKYNGSNWTQDSSPTSQNLTSVFVTSTSEAWAVGAAGTILKWNGSSWSTVSSPTGTQLNSISMLDTNGDGLADYGWAVGNSGVAIKYVSGTWSSQNIGGANNYQTVAIPNTNEAWAAGGSGSMYHWDGASWTSISSDETVQLNEIAMVAPTSRPTSGWHEVFP